VADWQERLTTSLTRPLQAFQENLEEDILSQTRGFEHKLLAETAKMLVMAPCERTETGAKPVRHGLSASHLNSTA
jgi:hypothetical protein